MSASPPAACGLHPSPVVHCCFRGGGRVAALRGLGPAAGSWEAPAFAAGSPAGSADYNGQGLRLWMERGGPAPASCDSCRRRMSSLGRGECGPPLVEESWRHPGPAGGEAPVSGSEREAFGPFWKPRGCCSAPWGAPDWAKSPSLTPVTSWSLKISHHGFVFPSAPPFLGWERENGRLWVAY